MTGGYTKLRLLLWKNWKMIIRNPLLTISEILVPVIFSALIILTRIIAPLDQTSETRRYPPFDVTKPPKMDAPSAYAVRMRDDKNITVVWSVPSGTAQDFTTDAESAVKGAFSANMDVTKMASPEVMENHLKTPGVMNMISGGKVLCGVVLDSNGQKFCSKELEITLRFPGDIRTMTKLTPDENWQTSFLFPKHDVIGPRYPDMTRGPLPSYYKESFLIVQLALAKEVMKICSQRNDPQPPEGMDPQDLLVLMGLLGDGGGMMSSSRLIMRRYSFPPYTADRILKNLRFVIPFLIMLSFIYTCLATTKMVTYEKETQMKELMMIMGLAGSLHWIAWFIRIMSLLIISIILIVILFHIEYMPGCAVFGYTDITVLFIFYLCYMIALTTFCFMISSFFTKGNIASVTAGLIWFLFYVPHFFLVSGAVSKKFPLTLKIPLSLMLNVGMAFGVELLLISEAKGIGVQWSNICLPVSDLEALTVCHCIFMLLLDSVIYMLICLYIEAVLPGMYGVPRPWYYFFTDNHWRSNREFIAEEEEEAGPVERWTPDNFEKEPKIYAGVRILHLRKEFGKTKVAVDNLTLNMYEGQITVLLGHNGAGKTTTMSILTGMYTPTKGKAIINRCNIARDMQGARRSLGLCPQHNVLFDELTVHEHFLFFCKLKGMKKDQLDEEISRFVVMLELEPKEHAKSCTLSGGMKRKLNAGIALCANSKVVLLDEPTSGMDPAARRAIWDMLIMEKEGRTLLLSTHFMDEADVLGDRIAIMAAGNLQCCGSSFFLKKKFGGGYRLIIEKGPDCDPDEVTDLLASHIGDVVPSQDIGSELSYQLAEEDAQKFEAMFRDLEQKSGDLDVKSYGIALTTMEEVFIKTGKDKESRGSIRRSVRKSAMPGKQGYTVILSSDEDLREDLVTGSKLTRYRLQALFMKKRLVLLRGWIIYFIHVIFPIIIICAVLLVQIGDEVKSVYEPRRIVLRDYPIKIVTTSAQNNVEKGKDQRSVLTRAMYLEFKSFTQEEGGELNDLKFHDNAVTSLDEDLLKKMNSDMRTTRNSYPVSASFFTYNDVMVIMGWFNDLPIHSSPLILSMMVNSMLRPFSTRIIFVNHPTPLSSETQGTISAMYSKSSRVAPMIAFAFAFVSAYYVQFIIRERECKNKHLQYVSGINIPMFWFVHACWDGIFFIPCCVTTILTLAVFRVVGYNTSDDLGRIFLILLCFGWAMLPLMYIFSFFFSIPATGYSRTAMFNIFVGTAAFLVISLFRVLRMAVDTIDILEWFVYFTPHYLLAHAIHGSYINHIYLDLCEPYMSMCAESKVSPCCKDKCPKEGCLDFQEDYFSLYPPGIGRDLIVMFLLGCFFFVILFIIEYRWFQTLREKCRKRSKEKIDKRASVFDDSDVAAEKIKIRTTDNEKLFKEYTLILRNVTKYYGNFLAVNRTCVGVGKGQCFGLLGSNGAGKTTTFKMMTGDIRMSEGDVFVDGINLRDNKKAVQQKMGYCPQFDALLDELTGWETLTMFCLMRGIPKTNIKNMSVKLADLLLMTKHMPKRVKTYSGGNKRKLSTAVALIGNPSVVFLDEPTTGMDPMARRHLWNVICNVRDGGTSVVLTSHSMEECEALCTKIAIQVNGNFKCLGSLQHLKNKFAKGYCLQIKVTPPSTIVPPTTRRDSVAVLHNSMDPVKDYVEETFKGAKLQDEYMGVLTFTVPSSDIKWSQMFGMMEKAKAKFDIEDYSIGQTSLEQVFLSFTKEQKSQD